MYLGGMGGMGKTQKRQTLTDPNFRNVSVITSLNTQKDQINDLGQKRKGIQRSKKASADVNIPINIQQILWNCSPHSSEHFPGKLSLCLGLPVMIRNNDATELCITKGQEAYIIGWDAIEGPQKQNVLETLYLELKHPPKPMQLPHLPKNVIPMTKTSKNVKYKLPNDLNVLPNFSMTDYASQGRTCLYNVVNLSHCQNFQSISSAAGTLIIQGFNSNKITQGLSGHLHQEFRELNLLNDITMKIYGGHINKTYFGPLHNPMIHKYLTEFKTKNETNNLHHDSTWIDIENSLQTKEEDDKDKSKCKISTLQTIDKDIETTPKKIKISSLVSNSLSPWDSINYSCAYNSLFTLLHHIWDEGQLIHKAYFENGTQYLQLLNSGFLLLSSNQCTFEIIHDHLRTLLHHKKPLQYHFGKNYTDIDELESYGTSHSQCWNHYTTVGWCSSDYENLQHKATIQQYINFKVNKKNKKTHKNCPKCFRFTKKNFPLYNTQYINKLPPILIFALVPWIDINNSPTFNISNSSKHYILKGIIYTNGNHFTTRLIDKIFNVWYHDGQTTHSLCQKEQALM
ncbi:hypothetical protein BYT27DRAFT_7226214 [Phlegmacium glaucopus]|nr:hypothetical protein BYT27DRAFT_7226214 [Phlegmacium glaucopus]